MAKADMLTTVGETYDFEYQAEKRRICLSRSFRLNRGREPPQSLIFGAP